MLTERRCRVFPSASNQLPSPIIRSLERLRWACHCQLRLWCKTDIKRLTVGQILHQQMAKSIVDVLCRLVNSEASIPALRSKDCWLISTSHQNSVGSMRTVGGTRSACWLSAHPLTNLDVTLSGPGLGPLQTACIWQFGTRHEIRLIAQKHVPAPFRQRSGLRSVSEIVDLVLTLYLWKYLQKTSSAQGLEAWLLISSNAICYPGWGLRKTNLEFMR